MKISASIQRRIHWINLPAGLLMILLQRTPVLRTIGVATESALVAPMGHVLKSALATVVALGGLHTLAGATELSASTASPATLAVDTPATIFFSILDTPSAPESWNVGGTLPPGMTFNGGATSGEVNVAVLTLSGTPTTPGNYTITLVANNKIPNPPLASTGTFTYEIVVASSATAPAITTQPQSQIVIAGTNVTITSGASGSPAPTFQWRKNNVDIGGATNSSLTLNNVQPSDAATYTVVATNSAGSVISNGAVLTVSAADFAPQITTQPVSQTVTAGAGVTFTVIATGNPTPTYQWRKNGAGIPGATNSSYSIASVSAGDAGTYTVVATNSVNSVTSNPAVLTVNVANVAPQIMTQPASQTVVTGAGVTFTATASGNPSPTYQWQKNGAGIPGATSSSYTIATTVPGDAGSYTVVATNSAGSATSNPATLTILSDAQFADLTKLFNRVLGRAPSNNELATYAGQSGEKVLTALLASSEYQATQIDRVIRLYYATFNRMPDRPGLYYWAGVIAAGQQSATQVAAAFATATEFNTTYGSLNNAQFVIQMYRNTLGRDPDQGGLDYWTGLLNGGFTRGEALLAFADSEEFKARMANEVEVVRLYTLLFQRMPTGGEVANWLSFLRGEDQTELFLDSAEFALLYPGGLSNAQFVQAMFSGFLLRGAEEASVTYFAGLLTAGSIRRSELIGQIVQSGEYRTVIAPVARHYLAVFLRPPDQAGAAYWTGQMRGGLTPTQLSQAFAGSGEFAASYAGLTSTQFVAAMYLNILGRPADAPGLAYWAGLLDSAQLSQAGLLQSFVESVEADARFAPDIRTTLHYQTFLSRTPSRGELDYWKAYLTTLREQLRAELLQIMP